jgi:hypothetical protein
MLITVTALLAVVTGPAFAQYPPLPEDEVVVSATTVVPGEPLTVASSGWAPGSVVTLTLFSDPVVLGAAEVGADTSFSTTVEIPESTPPGTHTLRISGTSDAGEPRVEELTIEVLGAGSGVDDVTTTANAGTLAFTGTNATLGLGLAAVLLVSGGITLLIARRRRNRLVLDE